MHCRGLGVGVPWMGMQVHCGGSVSWSFCSYWLRISASFNLRVTIMSAYLFNRLCFSEGDFTWLLEEPKEELSEEHGG